MRLSELIGKLSAKEDEHGDVQVLIAIKTDDRIIDRIEAMECADGTYVVFIEGQT